MATVFREPPLMGRMTVLAGMVAVSRRVAGSRRTLGLVLSGAHAPWRKRRLFREFRALPEDLFVATYPKSGTNWALQLALQTAWRGEAEFGHVHEAAPWPESPFPGIVPLSDEGWRAGPHPTRVIKSAIEARYLPVDSVARFLGVIRDPKEVAVSAYHFLPSVFGMTGQISPDDWVDWMLSPDWPLASWAVHASDLWALRDRPNVEVLLFHEMRDDLAAAQRRVERLIGVELTDEERARVLERSSFAWMKQHEDRFGPPRLRFTPSTATMMRKGKAGSAGELLGPDQQRRIDDHCRAELAELGSDLPYDALFGKAT